MKILVVDDDHDCADSYAVLLAVWGHSVVCAYDGPSAVAEMKSKTPDLVLLDLALPGMDGFKVARAMQLCKHKAVIIAMTGYGRAEDRLLTSQAGFDGHLTKPVPLDELQGLLNAWEPWESAMAVSELLPPDRRATRDLVIQT